MEWQRRGVIHFHSLIGNGAWKLLRIGVTDLWEDDTKYKRSKNGGNGKAWIEKYDRTKGAKGYLAKYISKSRRGELDIHIPHYMKKHFGIIPDANRVLSFLEKDKLNLVVN